jgi:hypothetical protein
MEEPIRPDIEAQLRSLSGELVQSRGLAAPAADALYRDIEDKFRAYRDGDAALTPEGALALVRERFRDPALLDALMGGAGNLRPAIPFDKRIWIALLAMLTVDLVVGVCVTLIKVLLLYVLPAEPWYTAFAMLSMLGTLIAGLVLCAVLMFALPRRIARSEPRWLSWPIGAFATLVVGLILLNRVVPPLIVTGAIPGPGPAFGPVMYLPIGALGVITACLAWLWWCDDHHPMTGDVWLTGAMFLAWSFFELMLSAVPRLEWTMSFEPGTQDLFGTVLSGQFPGLPYEWWLAISPFGALPFWKAHLFGLTVVLPVVSTLLATAGYLLVLRRLRSRRELV